MITRGLLLDIHKCLNTDSGKRIMEHLEQEFVSITLSPTQLHDANFILGRMAVVQHLKNLLTLDIRETEND